VHDTNGDDTQGRVEVTANEALDLQPLFDARPLGYGGADVAASFRAPPLDGDGGAPHTLWLLGDTFLGRVEKGKGQRLPGYFVHNSVGLLPVWRDPAREADPSKVAFWHNVSAITGGCPSSLFRHPSEVAAGVEDECHEGGQYLWPVAGVGVDLSRNAQVGCCFYGLCVCVWGGWERVENDGQASRKSVCVLCVVRPRPQPCMRQQP
jgi:hypothetical protein